jgi:ubiquinone/menaquinone biosynthesis C-methylase UbiE
MVKKILKNFIGDAGTKNLIDRQMWVKNVLLSLPAGIRILDAGAGECQYKQYCTHLNYVSQDFNEYKGDGNGAGIQTGEWDTSSIDIVSDIISIPEPDQSFDAVFCTEVFEHIPDPILAIKEFNRLLKPGGKLIITAPFNSLTHFAPYHYSSGFNKYFYEWHLTQNGFKIDEMSLNGDYSEYVAQEIRRVQTVYGKAPLYIKICSALLLRFININKKSVNTSELGCFGFHVTATKQ